MNPSALLLNVSQIAPAKTLRDIRKFCNPRPLGDGELDAFYVETLDARDPNCGVLQSIKSVLGDSESPKRILVYGHRGCGKSTELARLVEEL